MRSAKKERAAPALAGSGSQKNDRLTGAINSTHKQEFGGGQLIPLARIKDGGAQMRVAISEQTVSEYADAMSDGAVFPDVILYFDGTDYWLGDGFHRVAAARSVGLEEILAEVHPGTERDAILHGVGANPSHGLRRTQADKRRAVLTLLGDPSWGRWSDRKIAEKAKVSHPFVAKVRSELSGNVTTQPGSGNVTTHGGGNVSTPVKPNGKPNGGLLADVFTDAELIAECRRRGLTVEGDHA